MHFHAFSIDLNKSIVKENETKFSTCSVFPLCMQYANKKKSRVPAPMQSRD